MDVDVNQVVANAFVDELEKISTMSGGAIPGISGGRGPAAGGGQGSNMEGSGYGSTAAMKAPVQNLTGMGGGGSAPSAVPGYRKGGPVKKDGYLTDKRGRPYARVHRGERVVPGPLKDKLRE